ncbi:ComF family protein [Candidatus Ruminimicrobiellum ovillum]|uniref:ComF family protein n=1 Tax=Candidatus Ruminimicrobiellum ovillum TaxID=1947927 RepID=UPI00355A35FD
MKKILNFIISIIFPRTCSLCGKKISFNFEKNICNECIEKLPKVEGLICHKCSLPLPDGGATCSDCKSNKDIYFENLKSPYIYSLQMKKLIKKLKYSRKTFLAKDLSAKLADFIITENIDKNIDVVVPVPMHWLKKWKRGYNQAELLADDVARIINKPMYNALARTKYTKPQFNLKKGQRKENLEDMFAVNKKYADIIQGKRILLIDDIATTCSTANQCAKVLKNLRCKTVVVTLARA